MPKHIPPPDYKPPHRIATYKQFAEAVDDFTAAFDIPPNVCVLDPESAAWLASTCGRNERMEVCTAVGLTYRRFHGCRIWLGPAVQFLYRDESY